MLRFLCVVAVAVVLVPRVSTGMRGHPFVPNLDEVRSFSFQELCNLFCADDDYDYSFRAMDHLVQPRIFCGLCAKKLSTTTKAPPTKSTAAPTAAPTGTPTGTPTATPTSTHTAAPTTSSMSTNKSTPTTTQPSSIKPDNGTVPMAPAAPPMAAAPEAPPAAAPDAVPAAPPAAPPASK